MRESRFGRFCEAQNIALPSESRTRAKQLARFAGKSKGGSESFPLFAFAGDRTSSRWAYRKAHAPGAAISVGFATRKTSPSILVTDASQAVGSLRRQKKGAANAAPFLLPATGLEPAPYC
ncbi:MAG: hypothetical protein KGQ49_04350 [Verrucomicrobia bacterium]|nr:hypothetical protein [Verrucomicrobiota bacterium]